MSVEFRITSGARAGARERFEKSVVSIGRHPMNDLRFDPTKDIDVSGRHAELRSVGDAHVLHDIGSTNGTFVNGERITERALADGDVITFGAGGPQASFHVVVASAVAAPATRVEGGAAPSPEPSATGAPKAPSTAAAGTPPAKGPAAPAKPAAPARPAGAAATPKPRLNTEVRIAAAVERQTGKLRTMVLALAAFVVVGGAGTAYVLMRQAAEGRRQVAALLATNDSLARAFEARLAQTGLAEEALRAARADAERLNAALRERQAAGGDVSALSAQMRTAQARTANLSRVDFPAIAAANKPAIVFIAVEMPDGSTSSGTGFNLLPSGLIVTNRHVVQDAGGARARQVGVIFEGQQGEWREARIEAVSETDEIALLRLVRPGSYPIVSGVAGDGGVQVGSPISLLGFPLGTGTAGMDGNIDSLRPVATMNIGTVSKVLDDNIQLDVYAAQGSSGSPVLDARGLVVGVLFGAARESNGRIVYSVPAARLAKLLPADAAGIIR